MLYFVNLLSFDFQGEVKQAQVSGNLDAPEGGFDAIMQAITCHDQVRSKMTSQYEQEFSILNQYFYNFIFIYKWWDSEIKLHLPKYSCIIREWKTLVR